MLTQFEHIGRAIADPTRIRILKLLEPGELCVCQITVIVGLSPATTSKHLSVLRSCGLLAQRKEGRWVYYSLRPSAANPYAAPMLDLLGGLLEDDETIGEDRRRLDVVNSIPVQEVIARGHGLFDAVAS